MTKESIMFFLIFLSSFQVIAEDKSGYLEITGGYSFGKIDSGNIDGLLRNGINDPLGTEIFTMRYGSTTDILRNYMLEKMISPASVTSSGTFEIRYGFSSTNLYDMGVGVRVTDFYIRNAPGNSASGIVNRDEMFYLLGMVMQEVPNPALRDTLINYEYYDKMIVNSGYLLQPVTANFYGGYIFRSENKLRPYLRFSIGFGKDVRRNFNVVEGALMSGVQLSLNERSSISSEILILNTSFFGIENGVYKSGNISQTQIRAGVGLRFK